MVEIVADEIGPSLRWATAQVEKTQRTDSGGSGGGNSGGYQGGSSGGNSGGGNSGGRSAPDPVYGDEEPF